MKLLLKCGGVEYLGKVVSVVVVGVSSVVCSRCWCSGDDRLVGWWILVMYVLF